MSGQVIQDGDQVWVGGRRGSGQSLSIVLYADGERVNLQCSGAVCDRRTIRSRRSDRPWIRELFTAVAGLVRDEPDRFVPLITRGGVPLRESVLASGPGGVNLAPALSGQSAGDLRLEVAALDPVGSAGPWVPLRVLWTPGAAVLVPEATLPPGLYALQIENEPDTEAWVLVRSGPGSATDANKLDEISGRLREWTGAAATKDARTVLRAYLYQLVLGDTGSGHAP